MTYQHKRGSCSKDTKEILQNIFRHDLERYRFAESKHEKTETAGSSESPEKGMDNVLPAETAVLLSDDRDSFAGNAENPSGSGKLERYVPSHEVEFKALEAKETFEKKKKKRSYKEFRPEYAEEDED